MSCKFDTNIEILSLIQYWIIGTFVGTQRESSLSFGWNYFYRNYFLAEKQTVIWFTIVHASRKPGRLVHVFAWQQGWSHFPALRRYNFFLFSFASLHIGHQPSAWLTSDIVNGFETPFLSARLAPFLITARAIYHEDLISSYSHSEQEFRI